MSIDIKRSWYLRYLTSNAVILNICKQLNLSQFVSNPEIIFGDIMKKVYVLINCDLGNNGFTNYVKTITSPFATRSANFSLSSLLCCSLSILSS